MVAVSADNLASQALGGFIGLQSAMRKCRFCMATNKDIDSKVNRLLYVYKNNIIIITHSVYLYSLVQRSCK